jgi:hypothetical protein
MGIVDSVKPGEDGHVRTVSIRYTNPGKAPGERSPPKITTRPIHKIAVIVPVDYVFEDNHGPRPDGPGLPMLTQAEASGSKGDEATPPDPANQSTKRSEPGKKTEQKIRARQAPGKATEGPVDRPGSATAVKRCPGRPRKEARPNADPRAAQPASSPKANERPRRKAAIRAEENMRKGKDRNPEVWPLLQARGSTIGGTNREKLPVVCSCNTMADHLGECVAFGGPGPINNKQEVPASTYPDHEDRA